MHVSDLRHKNLSLHKKLKKLYAQRTRSRVNWDVAGYRELLRSMDDPQSRVPPVIHVAGTNGKGSIIAFLRTILEAQGYRVHVYTSPHLQRVNERFVIAGEEIGDAYLEDLIDEMQAQHNLTDLSFFEITTAIAFRAFSENPADVLLLEVGMGGRLDCTNVIEAPLVSVISRISYDHTEFLGEDIAQIAAEKAGIIKRGRPCVLGVQGVDSAEVLPVIESLAKKDNAPFYAYGRDWRVFREGSSLVFEVSGKKRLYPLPSLAGQHQIYNAGAALMALYLAREVLSVGEKAIEKGLKDARWPGRLQTLDPDFLGFPEKTEVWLDCGHNDSAGEALAHMIRGWTLNDPKPIRLVLGMLGHKDVYGFLAPMAELVDEIYLCGISGEPNGLTREKLEEEAGSVLSGKTVQDFADIKAALKGVGAAEKRQNGRVLIAGSVYLAGDVLSLAGSPHHSVFKD